jgi:hypothetical protein
MEMNGDVMEMDGGALRERTCNKKATISLHQKKNSTPAAVPTPTHFCALCLFLNTLALLLFSFSPIPSSFNHLRSSAVTDDGIRPGGG